MKNLEIIKQKLAKDGKYWIAFVGDSITSTEWVHPNWREIVEYVLKSKFDGDWGLKCFNFGYDGASTKDILGKVGEIRSINPNLVILMIGGNDPVLGINIADHVNNIKKIKACLDLDMVLSTDNKPWDEVTANKYLPYVEADRELGYGDFINLFEMSDSFPKERIYTFISEENKAENIKAGDLDYSHPNQLGNAYIAKVMLKKIWNIDFDPEKYIRTTLSGEKYPEY